MSKSRFSRRRFITSAGVTVTLPMLPSLLYTPNASAASCAPIKRFLAYHFPNGYHMAESLPALNGAGADWKWKATTLANADGTKSFPAGAATPLGKEIDPTKAFNRLFQGTDPGTSAADAEKRRVLRKSVLDAVVPHGNWLKNKLNPEDNLKVDELFTGIRSLEQEISSSANAPACAKPAAPSGSLDIQKKIEMFHTLMAVGFQCDITRVMSFMMGDALSLKNLSFIPDVKSVGGNSAHHSVSHHSGDAKLVAKFKAMVQWELGLIAGFIKKLKELTDADGKPVLDNTLVVIGSEIGDGNRHNHDDLLLITAGKLGGAVVTDRHKRFPTSNDYTKTKSFGDFFITTMGLYGVNTPSYGNDGKEAIEWNK